MTDLPAQIGPGPLSDGDTYAYTDEDGTEIEIEPLRDRPRLALLTISGSGVLLLPPEELPRLVAALYLAAGQDVPLVLPRPDILEEEAAHEWVKDGRIIAPSHDAKSMTSAQARSRAAAYAAAADLADAQAALMPDPAEVDALAEILLEHDLAARERRPGLPPIADGTYKDRARAILAAGYRRENDRG